MADTLAERYVDTIEKLAKKPDDPRLVALRVRYEIELDAETTAENTRLDAPDALGKAALFYARRGIAVFPCLPGDKKPATTHGFKDATTDEAKIRTWWADHRYNIGTPTGIHFDVIDIDGPEGVANFYNGDDAPADYETEIGHVFTPRQAGHHYYIKPTGEGNATAILPGVDYRGAGGYVLLPPSIGPNGKRYTWARQLQIEVSS